MYDKKDWTEVVQKAFGVDEMKEVNPFLLELYVENDIEEKSRLELRAKIYNLRRSDPIVANYFELWVCNSDLSWEEALMCMVVSLSHAYKDMGKIAEEAVQNTPMPPIIIPKGEPKE